MAATCQACVIGVPLIGTTAGQSGEPFGVCSLCSSLTCGQHGLRDAKGPAFVCIQCDVALQGASAGWITWRLRGATTAPPRVDDPDDAQADLLDDLLGLLSGPQRPGLQVRSVQEWMSRRRAYRQLLELVSQDLENLLERLQRAVDDTRQASMRGLIAYPSARSSPDVGLVRLWEAFNEDARKLIAAALVLALVMNLPRWSLPDVLGGFADLAKVQFREDFPEPGQTVPVEENRYR